MVHFLFYRADEALNVFINISPQNSFTELLSVLSVLFSSPYFVVNHQEGVFQGLIPILNCYLENMEVDVDTRCTILNYLKLIKKRASGKVPIKKVNTINVLISCCFFSSVKLPELLLLT